MGCEEFSFEIDESGSNMIVNVSKTKMSLCLELDDDNGMMVRVVNCDSFETQPISLNHVGYMDYNRSQFIFTDVGFNSLYHSTNFKTAATLASI
jgi:hypothetical protein